MVFAFTPQHRFPPRPWVPPQGFQQQGFQQQQSFQQQQGFRPQQGFQLPRRNDRVPQQGWTNRGWINGQIPATRDPNAQVPHGWGNTQPGNRTARPVPPLPAIPIHVVHLVATHLASTRAFATLASLNVTCRAIHETTLRDLYGTVYWNWSGESNRSREEAGWGVDWMMVEKWKRMRWDDRLQSAKGSPHIDFLLGPPMHRHFFVARESRKNWIPKGLVGSLKAAITYKIDATSAFSTKPADELEVYLCGRYRFGTHDVVELLDAVEPPLQDSDEPISDATDKTFYTRLVVLLDMTQDDLRWCINPSAQESARETLESRTYPWLRQVDLVLCTPQAFDQEDVAVAVAEGLTMLIPAVRTWWRGDNDARPELVVKGLDIQTARTCAEIFARSIEDDEEYSCVDFKLLGTDLAHTLDVTSAQYILHPLQSAYVSLCLDGRVRVASYGSTIVGDLGPADRDDGIVGRDVHASVEVMDSREVQVMFAEKGKAYLEHVAIPSSVVEPSWGDY